MKSLVDNKKKYVIPGTFAFNTIPRTFSFSETITISEEVDVDLQEESNVLWELGTAGKSEIGVTTGLWEAV